MSVLERPWRLPVARTAGAAVVVGAFLGGWLARHNDTDLGAATAPLFMVRLDALPSTWWWPLAVIAACVAAAVALLRAGERVGPRAFALCALLLAVASRAGIAVGQRGFEGLWYPVTRDGAATTDYPAAFALVRRDPLRFVDHFAELVPYLPVHPSGHPAGATLLAWGIAWPFGAGEGYALALIGLGALSAIPVYWLARRLLDDGDARAATLIWVFAPATLLFGATSLDALLVGLAAATAALLLSHRTVAGACVAAVSFLVSYASPLAVVWAALVLGRRGGLRAALAALVATLALLGVLALTLGYDPVGAIQATHDVYQRGIGGRRPQWYWIVGGPAAFLIALGPLLAERWLFGVERATAGARALLACVLLAAVSGVMEAEVERIWQFAIPFAAIAAAPLIGGRAPLLLAAGAAQAYVIEILWDTTF